MKLKNTLAHLLILNYPVPVAQMAARIPPPLELDTLAGSAWLSLLAFEQQQFAPLDRLGPGFNFAELNYRTYVRWQQHRGVYFFRLDFGRGWLARLSRGLFGMPATGRRIELEVERGEENGYLAWRLRSPELVIAAHSTGRPAGGDWAWFLQRTQGFFTHRNGTVRHFQVERCQSELLTAQAKVSQGDFLKEFGVVNPAEPAAAALMGSLKLKLIKFPPGPL